MSAAAAAGESIDDMAEEFVWARRKGMRCIAIVAHVDHGKTSLVDKLLQVSSESGDTLDRLMDSGDLEKERGITITSKVTRVRYTPSKSEDPVIVNIADR
jgi:GTP-binding protein